MRLAYFSPLPPDRSGIARYTTELLPFLGREHHVDVYAAGAGASVPAGAANVFNAHDFVWREKRHPYDLSVYQLGNATCHDYMWPYITRYPGLVVLHDGQLHHARARLLLADRREARYRTELALSHPEVPNGVAELGVQGLLGHLTYLWPMVRIPIIASRMVAVHNAWLADRLTSAFPQTPCDTIRMGVTDPTGGVRDDNREALRNQLGLRPQDVVFAAIGGITPEKRIPQVLRALAAVGDAGPRARLMLIGSEARHYDVQADIDAHGVDDRVIVAGYVDDASLEKYLAAVDVCVCLRWPSSGETSASWLRCLAAGKPTVVTDLASLREVPTLVTRGVFSPSHVGSLREYDDERQLPVAVAIDLLDEDRSLAIAMRRLASDADLRDRIGTRARRYWSEHHQCAAMAEDYARVIAAAAGRPGPVVPPELLADGTAPARELLAPFDVLPDTLQNAPG